MRREKLVALRKQLSWSQKDVTNQLNSRFNISITESYYGMIEQGVRTPKLEIAIAISELFKCNPKEIFFDNENNKMLSKSNTA